VTGANPTLTYATTLIPNPVNPQAVTPHVRLGVRNAVGVHTDYPLMGMIGRPGVAHFAGVTQWTYTGKQINGVRLIQIHPKAAAAAGVKNGDRVVVESPRGSADGTALLWEGLREDTVFVPNTFGPSQAEGDEFGLPRYQAANHLTDDRYFDNLSGQQAYKCFACRLKKG
jgi:anaerobic selenocysteine-containing dehydrogenase